MDISKFLEKLKKQAKRNDNKISPAEKNIIRAVSEIEDEAPPEEIYFEVLKAAYSDHKLAEDESDLVAFSRDFLKITDKQHRNALEKLGEI